MLLESGDVKRAKYHDDSKKVSKVSVSLIAGFPEYGHVVNFQVGWFSSGLPGLDRSISSEVLQEGFPLAIEPMFHLQDI